MFAIAILAICVFSASAVQRDCTPSVTTASGTRAPTGEICPGDLIFEDNFDFIDFSKWSRENTLSGGGVSKYLKVINYGFEVFKYKIICRISNFNFIQQMI